MVVLIASATLLSCCKKDNTEPQKTTVEYTVSTTATTAIAQTTATSGGSITVTSGTLVITERGVCYGTTVNPTVSLATVPISGSSLTAFTSSITGLTANTTYHVRAYAISESGVKYGNDVVFTTLNNPLVPVIPTVITNAATSITQTTAASGGNITSNGGATVTASGICYSTTANPTTASSLVSSTTLTGSFTSNLTGLTSNTTYYVRAYATNSVGTAYGTQVTFNTLAELPTVTTTTVGNIDKTTATSGGNVTIINDAAVTARGVCWSVSVNPTITDSHTSDGASNGTFVSNITGLTAGTLYHVRAYATNSAGTAYGNDVTFTTNPTVSVIPTISTTSASSITNTTATSGGNITSNGGSAVTVSGICWSTSINPTTSDNKTTDGTLTGSFTSNITGLVYNTTYHVRAYATNSIGTAYGADVTFTTTSLVIGQSYQGGIIAYILQSGDAGYSAIVQHGLIAATSDQSASKWSNNGNDITTSQLLGTGLANTNAIVANQGAGTYAAKVCQDLGSGWYLPSRNELTILYTNRVAIGGFSAVDYWSSSQSAALTAITRNFSTGAEANTTKGLTIAVRAIRSF